MIVGTLKQLHSATFFVGNLLIVDVNERKKFPCKRGVNKSEIHRFRHTFAKNSVLAGMDVFTLMRVLQHKDLQTTLEYVKILNVDAKNACDTYNPQKIFNVNNTSIKVNKKK